MNLNEYLDQISKEGIQLSVDNDNIRVRAPKGKFTEQHRETFSVYKKEILLVFHF